jgi:hypothetical protein
MLVTLIFLLFSHAFCQEKICDKYSSLQKVKNVAWLNFIVVGTFREITMDYVPTVDYFNGTNPFF